MIAVQCLDCLGHGIGVQRTRCSRLLRDMPIECETVPGGMDPHATDPGWVVPVWSDPGWLVHGGVGPDGVVLGRERHS